MPKAVRMNLLRVLPPTENRNFEGMASNFCLKLVQNMGAVYTIWDIARERGYGNLAFPGLV